MPVIEVQYLTKRPVRSAPGATNQACIVIRDFGHEVLRVQAEARVRAAFCAARLRPTGPFVRTAFAAALRKLSLPRVRPLDRACPERASLDAAGRPSLLRTPLIARDRFAEGRRFVAFVVFPLGLGPSFTPARRAFDKPIAIACLVLRAPCLPSRIGAFL